MNDNTNVKTKKPNKFKPNIIDFLVIVVIIAVIAGIVARNTIQYSNSDDENLSADFEQVRVSFRIADISENTAEYFKTGDAFFSVSHNCTFGILETFQTNPAELYVVDQEGTLYKRQSISGRVDLTGTFISEGVFKDDGFMLEGLGYLIPGSEVSVKSASVTAYILITDVERIARIQE